MLFLIFIIAIPIIWRGKSIGYFFAKIKLIRDDNKPVTIFDVCKFKLFSFLLPFTFVFLSLFLAPIAKNDNLQIIETTLYFFFKFNNADFDSIYY